MDESIKRKVHFFTVSLSHCSFDEVHKKLNLLQNDAIYSKDEERWFYLSEITKQNKLFLGILHSIRLGDLPLVAKLRQKTATPLDLESDEGLVESSHFIFDSSNNILVMEYNYHGPSWSVLESHTNEKIFEPGEKDQKQFKLNLIMNNDFQSKLDEMGSVYRVEMEFPVARANQLREIDHSIFDSIAKVDSFGEVDTVSLVFKGQKWSKKPMLDNPASFKARILRVIGHQSSREVFSKLKVSAFNKDKQKKAAFDLLEDKLLVEIDTVKRNKRSRAVNSEDMFRKLNAIYHNKLDILKKYVGNN